MWLPYTNTNVIFAQIELRFVSVDDLFPFPCSPIPLCPTPLQTEASGMQLAGAIGSIRNGCHHTRCPSARFLVMLREDPRARREGAAGVWIVANEAAGSTRVCHMM
ncbi:hypothetical protein TNCV_3268551 [Trichonephila clavipes]|nr:hypothetical protein TNCV_3268551 [Trichonephila clavipes]